MSRDNEMGVVYISKVMNLTDKHIYFGVPTKLSTGHFGAFEVGDVVTITYRAVDDSACAFRGIIVGQEDRYSDLCYFVAKPSLKDVTRTQMREYVRGPVPVNTVLEFTFPDYPVLEAVKHRVLPCDISGGGIAFFVPATTGAKVGDALRIQFQLPGSDQVVSATCRIIRVQDVVNEGIDLMRRVHLAFNSISERDRQSIVRYVFRRQIELKARGQL